MRILVIMATYNGDKYIKEQIESILLQNEVDLDLMIFDDASKDNTVQVIELFAAHNKITLVQNSEGTGSAANNFFNALQNLSNLFIRQYEYIAFADQDDIWLPKKLSAAIKILQDEKTNLYMSNLTLWDEKTNTKSILSRCSVQKKYDFLFEGGSAGCTYVFTNTFCIDFKQKLITVDYTNWKFFSHDWFVYFFARINNYGVSIDSNSYILYRIHENNIHGQLNKNSFFAIKERLKIIKQGWYFEHIKGFIKLLPNNSSEKRIYECYYNNYFSRLYVLLRYNFSLIRSSKKFLQNVLVNT
jgi:rhamnosyltransferase